MRIHAARQSLPAPVGRPAPTPTLFERLVRGYRSTVLGLGLYLARGIAEAHGGTLSVDSAGSGTTFRLALPVEGARHAT